ncbi:2,3-bisphosphoglycerate-independent phosphoglycerate mutase [Methanococcoides alaskense]|uniref:2,3-bisphosphoglycerate-independent phosphoglycerate mutase n=1 Tax=Methanococcoides alaskense TaxID=325778 RepID=A0AA90Z6Z2_9EURY|nr:2,3-bisphosphoglycerate-independent phosphoglycerate mutase [Methanococcoides alaskense]MDA0525540.1 2,3-bisphosphoglycerate-independent phosphoglycerate mutase [Methanococcoides alaskense]MDR6222320.1 2,3-bisphosphoglycerate-independent phosphoglycerate mutase [Methanococcoides alaskense]
MNFTKRPFLLTILDGWGYSPEVEGNAIHAANTPNLDNLLETYPNTLLSASGEDVGLPEGQMGNSEVGHLNIGAGRVVYQDLTRINRDIGNGDFFKNPVLKQSIENAKAQGSALHLMGLFSYGGVHSHMKHLCALIEFAKDEGITDIFVHAFLDGRDVPPRAALEDMKEHVEYCNNLGVGKVATVSGRYYAMDRDNRWDRIEDAYNAITLGEGSYHSNGPVDAILEGYERGENDEFIKPTVIVDENGKPIGTVNENDTVIFFNFRPDRARQLTYTFVNDEFDNFERKSHPKVHFVCMTEYDERLDVPIAFSSEELKNTLGEVLSKEGIKQLRIAETEKYAHVTFFFNGGVEKQNEGEERCLIPSPKVATYDLKPEMSAYEVSEELIERIGSGKYDVIVLNLANMDMVGHSGIMEAAVKAVEVVDDCVGKIITVIKEVGGEAMIMADHGNAEKMVDFCNNTDKQCHTAHTSNPVRCIYVTQEKGVELQKGRLSDIAPTILKIMGIEKPPEMTGVPLIKNS